MMPGLHLQDDRRPLEPESCPQLILEVSAVGEMKVDGVVQAEEKVGGCYTDLGCVEDLDGVGPFSALGASFSRLGPGPG